VVIGPDEAQAGIVNLKDLQSGEQHKLALAEAVAHVVAMMRR
jgi:histidyl-tRNA synthetase